MRASGVVIRKPGTDDSTTLKTDHSIFVVSCTEKVVENVVADILAE
jgi:hypothetical protein